MTPVAVKQDTVGPMTAFDCGGPVTPTADALILGVAAVGGADTDFDGPPGSRAAPDANVTEEADYWDGFRPLCWAGYREVASPSGSYTIGATIEAGFPTTYFAGITIVLGSEAGDCCPDAGQWVRNERITMAGTTGTTRCPFADGSLEIVVDGIPTRVTETDPAAGVFDLDFEPVPAEGDSAGETVTASYQGR